MIEHLPVLTVYPVSHPGEVAILLFVPCRTSQDKLRLLTMLSVTYKHSQVIRICSKGMVHVSFVSPIILHP